VPDDLMIILLQEKFPVYFIQLSEFIALHLKIIRLQSRVDRGTIDPTEYEAVEQLLEDLKSRVKLLVVDDVGKEHRTASGFAQDEFDLLVRTRHNRGLATIYTSNIPLEEWSNQYSASMQNLIQRSSLVLEFRPKPRSNRARPAVNGLATVPADR
jgi:DNA replication protein DnaC